MLGPALRSLLFALAVDTTKATPLIKAATTKRLTTT
jgi:hypothetical protein